MDASAKNTPRTKGVAGERTRPIGRTACPAVLAGVVEATILAPIREKQCGLQSAYRVRGVWAGGKRVTFSTPATLNCDMAGELANWLERVTAYTKALYNSRIEVLETGTSYACRTRNNVPGAKISEHGFANALDVRGFKLADGTRIRLPNDWANKDRGSKTMGAAHDAACRYFTTVLGPHANALHRDHLHLDLGCHGRTCRVKICE